VEAGAGEVAGASGDDGDVDGSPEDIYICGKNLVVVMAAIRVQFLGSRRPEIAIKYKSRRVPCPHTCLRHKPIDDRQYPVPVALALQETG
jgi:hypothetical protein